MTRRYAALYLLIWIAVAITPGCGLADQGESDPEVLFHRALERYEAEGGSTQRSAGSLSAGTLAKADGYELNPLQQTSEFRSHAEHITLDDELSDSRYAVLRVGVQADAARRMLERQLRSNVERIEREAELTLEDARRRLSAEANRELEGELRSRLNDADLHIKRIADKYEVRTVVRLWVDRAEGKAVRMQVDTTIVDRGGGDKTEEKLSDTYMII